MWKKISMVKRKPMCYGSAAPVEQGVSAYLTPDDRWIKAILLSPVASKVWSPHGAVSVNRDFACANPLHVIIPQHRKLSMLGSVAGLCPQDRSSSKGGKSDLHAQVLPLVSRNAVKIFAFGLSSKVKLSVTKTSFTSCRPNAYRDTHQLPMLQN